MTDCPGIVVSNNRNGRNQFEMVLRLDAAGTTRIIPGQFCMLSVGDSGEHILRRPFSVFRVPARGKISVLYKIAGEGTRILSCLKKGDRCSVLLPLGNGFPLKKIRTTHLYAVAGGIGAASVHALLSVPARSKKFFYGVASKPDFCRLKIPGNVEFFKSTLDGSAGTRGLVTDLLLRTVTKDLTSRKAGDMTVCACGPMAMLKTLYTSLTNIDSSINMFFALEERMACGFGVCMGCVIPTKTGYRRTCVHGPVFPANEIDWSDR